MEEKEKLRKKFKQILKDITKVDFTKNSDKLSENLNQLIILKNFSSKQVGVFSPIKREPIWHSKLGKLEDFNFSFPRLENNKMVFRASSFAGLRENNDFGVDIPSSPKAGEVITPDILLIPGLAFSLKGERLGRGKGYYDKYLSNFKGYKIGICFFEQITNNLVTEEHDVAMDMIITNEKQFIF